MHPPLRKCTPQGSKMHPPERFYHFRSPLPYQHNHFDTMVVLILFVYRKLPAVPGVQNSFSDEQELRKSTKRSTAPKVCHCEPARTLVWQSASPDVRRNSLHSVSAVPVSAAKTTCPLLPSSSPNQSKDFDLEKENRGNGYGAGGPKPGCGMECARLDADCHTSDVGHWFAMTRRCNWQNPFTGSK